MKSTRENHIGYSYTVKMIVDKPNIYINLYRDNKFICSLDKLGSYLSDTAEKEYEEFSTRIKRVLCLVDAIKSNYKDSVFFSNWLKEELSLGILETVQAKLYKEFKQYI